MARLPTPGGDDNTWGDVLNDFLNTEHNADGSQKPLPQSKVTNLTSDLAAKAPIASPTFTGTVTLPGDPGSNLQAATKQYVDSAAAAGAPDATTTNKGIVQLAGDLGGTAASPTVPGLSAKADASALTTHTSNVSNPHSVTKAQVGLGNADNTSDASKPVSTAQQTALNAKAPTASPTLTGTVTVPDGSFSAAKLSFDPATQVELDAHINDAAAAHAATAVSFTPAGTIASTTVQAAIEEVASEAGDGSQASGPATITRNGSGIITTATVAGYTIDTIVRDGSGRITSFNDNGTSRTVTRDGSNRIMAVS